MGQARGDLAAQLGLVLRDLLSADLHSAGPGKKSAGLMRKAELKFQPTTGNSLHTLPVSGAGLNVI